MDHQTVKDKLFALHDRELPEEIRQEVAGHLANCSECHETYVQWQRTANAFFQPPRIQTSEAFVYQVMERVNALKEPRGLTPWGMRIRWLAPALGLTGVLLLFMGQPSAVSVEALLLAERQDQVSSRFVFASEPPTTDEVFGFIVEGQP
jgi:anti-sigma factor RsiW